MNAKSLVGSVEVNLCGSHYPLHMPMVDASRQRVMNDKAFSVPKFVLLSRMLLRAVPGPKVENLSDIWGEELLKLEKEISSDIEKQTASGKTLKKARAVNDNDMTNAKSMEFNLCSMLQENEIS